ncbi:leucine-rich repeat domain-containing protein [Steroidobacter cummioxidans]|uniref:leucine-rich repeat domain-containing protein n=1 Tax=Steroidobacter cummioxidans TaxID=1803913 RepID=UPI000E31AB04|nr:leucine-rich repeat domain-containing protein [Steroidobacter cummioxidans]
MTRQANPYLDRTVSIVETRPGDSVVPKGVRAIAIVADKSNYKARPSAAGIDDVIARLPASQIDLLEIDYESRSRTLPDLRRLTNLRFLHIGGRDIREIGDLSSLTKLESLYIANAKVETLSALRAAPLKKLRLIRGSVETVDIEVSYALLQACQRLRRFGPARIRRLTLETCNRVDLRTLSEASGLVELRLISRTRLDDVSFLEGCSELRTLAMATKASPTGFDSLRRCKSLRNVFLALGSTALRKLAVQYPAILFSNGTVSYRGREELPGSAFYTADLD